jgi:hypothetical protein
MRTDYACLLRRHAANWTVVFCVLVPGWVVAVMASLATGNAVPALAASVVLYAAGAACRIRYKQLLTARDAVREQEDEALIRALRESLRDL